MITLDQLAAVRLIKIDVEGMELEVIAGAQATVARCRPVLYVENDRAEKVGGPGGAAAGGGFRMWWHTLPLYNPANFLADPTNVSGDVVSFNMFCLPRETTVQVQGVCEASSP